MTGKRMEWPRLAVLGFVIAIAVSAVWVRLRRRDDTWADDLDEEWTQVAVPVEAADVRGTVAVPLTVGAAEDPAPVGVPVAVIEADAGGSPFGPGSAAPAEDGGGPSGWTIKAKTSSRLYHTPSSPSWGRMHADAWFETEAAAAAAGFERWDRRRTGP